MSLRTQQTRVNSIDNRVAAPVGCVPLTIDDELEALFVSRGVGVAISGTTAYQLSSNLAHLSIVNATDPTNLILLKDYDLNAGAFTVNQKLPTSIAVSGGFAYVANYDVAANCYLAIYNVTNPLVITQVGSVLLGVGTINGSPRHVALDGAGFCYVAFGDDIKIINVTVPAAPVISAAVTVATFPGDGAGGVFVSGTTLFATGLFDNVLKAWNVTIPALPVPIFSTPISDVNAFTTNNVYAAGGLVAVSITTLPAVISVEFFNLAGVSQALYNVSGPGAFDVAIKSDGTRTYILTGNAFNNFRILNTSVPATPAAFGNASVAGSSAVLAITSDHAFVSQTIIATTREVLSAVCI
jgi:hypothetical protein